MGEQQTAGILRYGDKDTRRTAMSNQDRMFDFTR